MIAALFIDRDGPYPKMQDVDCWDAARDAREYPGESAVVAHPPCGRWCQMAPLNERRWGAKVGDDGGCFESALASVNRWGGVLEHPAESLAWPRYGLSKPRGQGWQASLNGGWTCEVWQSAYGHKARKRTWLYYRGENAPFELDWSRPRGTHQIGGGIHTGNRLLPRLEGSETHMSPVAFAEALVNLARASK